MQNEVNGMVNIAILGFGTVGSGVAEVLTRNGGLIDGRVNNQVRLKYIMRARDIFEGPYKDLFVKDFSIIERDPEVSIVVETHRRRGRRPGLYHPGPEGGQERGHGQQGAGRRPRL